MGFFDFLFKTITKNTVSSSHPSLPLEYYDFEEKYSEKIDTKYENLACSLDDLRSSFDESYNYKKRLAIIEKAIKKCDDFSGYLDSLGSYAMIYFSDMHGFEPFTPPEAYDVDFDFLSESPSAWKWLYDYYVSNPDLVSDVLYRQFISDNYDSEEDYLEELAFEKTVKDVSSSIIKIIKQNGGSMKKTELIKCFTDENEKNAFCLSLSRLEDSGKIIRSKAGNRIVFSIAPK